MGKHGLSERDALIGDAPSSLSIFSPHALPTHVKHCCIFPASISRQSHPGVLLPVSDSVPPPSLQEGITALDAVGEDTLLSASDDRTLRLWKVADETQLLFSGGEASLMLSLDSISPICQSPFFPYLTLKFVFFVFFLFFSHSTPFLPYVRAPLFPYLTLKFSLFRRA